MQNIVEIKNITKIFNSHSSLKGSLKTYALDDVSLNISKNSITGIVGQSGSGKSTLARIITSLIKQTSGEVLYDGKNLEEYIKHDIKGFRKEIQMVFQDPSSTLNPRLRIQDSLVDPLNVHTKLNNVQKREKMMEMLKRVEMDENALARYPHEFSGGQRQRIGIARALLSSPSFLILDEPVSALDISIQGQILNLLLSLKKDYNLTYMFITHDLALVRYMCDDVVVLYNGRIMETGTKKDVFENTAHPYTKLLLDSAFNFKIETNDESTNTDVADKCVFYPHCKNRTDKCVRNIDMISISESHKASCINIK